MKLDILDKKILSALLENSKILSKELSKKLKIHPNTLLQRLKKLEGANVIVKYSATVDFSKFDRNLAALIFLDIDMEKQWEEALKPLARHPDIVSFTLISGAHDALISARVKDERHLANLLRKLTATGVISKTTTHLVMDHLKWPYEYNPLKDELMFS